MNKSSCSSTMESIGITTHTTNHLHPHPSTPSTLACYSSHIVNHSLTLILQLKLHSVYTIKEDRTTSSPTPSASPRRTTWLVPSTTRPIHGSRIRSSQHGSSTRPVIHGQNHATRVHAWGMTHKTHSQLHNRRPPRKSEQRKIV